MTTYQADSGIPWKPLERTVPMKVIVVGLWRTGTSSLKEALHQLGYNDVFPRSSPGANNWNSEEFTREWNETIDDKFVDGKHIGHDRFDELLGDCMAITGMPSLLFLPELISAYPEAKIILTTRDVESWHESITQTFDFISTRPIFPLASMFSRLIRTRTAFLNRVRKYGWAGDPKTQGKRVYAEHVARVRGMVAGGEISRERYLELPVGGGWGPLCELLGEEVPDRPWPKKVQREEATRDLFPVLIGNARWVVFWGLMRWTGILGVAVMAFRLRGRSSSGKELYRRLVDKISTK